MDLSMLGPPAEIIDNPIIRKAWEDYLCGKIEVIEAIADDEVFWETVKKTIKKNESDEDNLSESE